jgi:hypothetical protein
VWPGAQPPLDQRAAAAARHLNLAATRNAKVDLATLTRLAGQSGVDLRDLEGGLVRLALTHRHSVDCCAGGPSCMLLTTGRR